MALVLCGIEGRENKRFVTPDGASDNRSKSRHNERSNEGGRSGVTWCDVSRSRRTPKSPAGDDPLPASQGRENALPGRSS